MDEQDKKSKQLKNKLVRFVDAIEARRDEKQTKAFTPRNFVTFGLPYRQPTESYFERRDGAKCFRIVCDPQFGVPFGQDRLIPIWLATAFRISGMPEDNCIRFRSLTDILRAFEMPGEESIGGRERGRLRSRLQRVFGATYFAWDESKGQTVLTGERYQLMARMRLFFDSGAHPNQYSLWQNVIELDARFANDIRKGAIPIDLNSVRALKGNPAALDLYVWMAWRSWRCQREGEKEVRVPLFGESGLTAQLGTHAQQPKKVRELLRRQLKLVQAVWSGCPNTIQDDVLIIRPADPVGKASALLPGVTRNPPVPLLPVAKEKQSGWLALDAKRSPKKPEEKPVK